MPRRHKDLGYPESILPPPRHNEPRPIKYMIPRDLHEALEREAQARGYRTREFAIEILKRALNSK